MGYKWGTIMKIELLADDVSVIDTISKWYYEQWCQDSDRYSMDEIIAKVSASVNRDKLPMILLLKQGNILIGTAELKRHEMPCYPQYEYWLGGVYIKQSARGQGAASYLTQSALIHAKALGVKQLYLQTDALNGGLYRKLGFTAVEINQTYGDTVLVMVAKL